MKINPNKFVPNGFGVPPEPRREKNLAERLYDQLEIALNSLEFFREAGDSRGVADCEDTIRDIRVKIDELVWQRRETHCPVCGRELDKFPHSSKDCAERELKDDIDDFEFRQCLRSL